MSATEILEQIRRLPPKEQHEVVEQILAEFDEPLTPAQLAEFERRAGELRRNPESGIPWEQVRAELKERLKNRPCPAK